MILLHNLGEIRDMLTGCFGIHNSSKENNNVLNQLRRKLGCVLLTFWLCFFLKSKCYVRLYQIIYNLKGGCVNFYLGIFFSSSFNVR